MTNGRTHRGPGVHVPPPLLFVAGFAAAWALDRWWVPFQIDDDGASIAQSVFGMTLAVLGFVLMVWGIVTLVNARTSILPNRPTRRLVVHGPYRLSRNPMYTGLAFLYVGIALVLNAAWPLLLLPIVLGSVYVFVIKREEQYLSSKFGSPYDAYKRQVRRWI